MASVDSPEQRERALELGWKTFRVRAPGEPVLPGEFVCPKGTEAERRLLCVQCGACRGGRYTGQATPVTQAHGLPALRRQFAANPRRHLLPLPLGGREQVNGLRMLEASREEAIPNVELIEVPPRPLEHLAGVPVEEGGLRLELRPLGRPRSRPSRELAADLLPAQEKPDRRKSARPRGE
jgi:hypothetical protein